MSVASRVLMVSLAGAVVGGVVGYLYLTESGGRFVRGLEPGIDRVTEEIRRWRIRIDKAQRALAETWRSINELAGESERAPQFSGPKRHSSPF